MVVVRSLALATSLSLAASACGSPASFPGRPEVTAAQGEWCDSLAKISGYGAAWEPLDDCKAAVPSASPAYLRAMTRCLAQGPFAHFVEIDPPVRMEALSRTSEVHRQMVRDCHEEVAANLGPDPKASEAAISKLCRRAELCGGSAPSCRDEVAKRAEPERAFITAVYNEGSRGEIAACLDGGCQAEDKEAREGCFRVAKERLLWFPP